MAGSDLGNPNRNSTGIAEAKFGVSPHVLLNEHSFVSPFDATQTEAQQISSKSLAVL
jgi:hypothetical protein